MAGFIIQQSGHLADSNCDSLRIFIVNLKLHQYYIDITEMT